MLHSAASGAPLPTDERVLSQVMARGCASHVPRHGSCFDGLDSRRSHNISRSAAASHSRAHSVAGCWQPRTALPSVPAPERAWHMHCNCSFAPSDTARTGALTFRSHLSATRASMKMRLFLIPAIFATTAALADSQTAVAPKAADAQAQAAALLSRPQTAGTTKLENSALVAETAIDAHASAAALLSGHRIARQATMSSAAREPLYGRTP